MIAQHIETTTGNMPTTGGIVFEVYEGDTGKMWNAMRYILSTCAVDVQTENAIKMASASSLPQIICDHAAHLSGWIPRQANVAPSSSP